MLFPFLMHSKYSNTQTTGTRNHTHLGFFNTLKSKTGLMVARAAALRANINIDGRPRPTVT